METNEHPQTLDLSCKVMETEVAHVCYSDDTVTVTLKEHAAIDVGNMRQLLATAVEMTAFKKYFVIVDARTSFHAEEEVRNYYATNEYASYRYADAFVIKSLPTRLLVNFYITVHKPSIPTKTFNDPQQAKQWIDEMKQRFN